MLRPHGLYKVHASERCFLILQARRGLSTPRPWVKSYPGFKSAGGGGSGVSGGGSLVCPKCHGPVTLVPLTNAAMLSTEVSAIQHWCCA